MKINRGKIHEYLGMTLDFSISGEVKITMTPYIREVIEDFSKYDPGSKTARTSAANHLFKVRDDAKPISEKLAQIFHTFVAKSLFATKMARPEISTTVSFLTTRVIEPDEYDWKKLVRMIRYLNGSPDLPLTLKADSTNIVKWWVDGSYAVHPTSGAKPAEQDPSEKDPLFPPPPSKSSIPEVLQRLNS